MRHAMRRKDRAMDADEARALLESGEYGVFSTVDGEGQPYGVPLNYVVIEDAIYMHAAKVGHKIDNIGVNSKAAFCVVGATELLDGKFSTRYQSVIVLGKASLLGEDQTRGPLAALIKKYFPDEVQQGEIYIDKMIHATAVIKVTIDDMTGKARR